jgi:hypothetical protein
MVKREIDPLEDMRIVAYTLSIVADNILLYKDQVFYKDALGYMNRFELEQVITDKELILKQSSNYERFKRKIICLLRNGKSSITPP